jgi:hypothetical protein
VARHRLDLTRAQVFAYRRNVGALDERLPPGPHSLRRAAWAGLHDSMPCAALLWIHARVVGTEPATQEDPSLVQPWRRLTPGVREAVEAEAESLACLTFEAGSAFDGTADDVLGGPRSL